MSKRSAIMAAVRQQGAVSGLTVDPSWFAFTVNASLAGISGANSFTIPSTDTSYQIQWEEVGNSAANNSGGPIPVSSANYVIGFGAPGNYRVFIDPVTASSNFKRFRFANGGDKVKMKSVEQWGTTVFDNMVSMFHGCVNFEGFTASDSPVVTGAYQNSLLSMFESCTTLTATSNINSWATGTIATMGNMFKACPAANPVITAWDVSAVTSFSGMFNGASVADPDTTSWATTAVTNLSYMFTNAGISSRSFDNFDVSRVTTAANMLIGVTLTTAHYNATLIDWEAQTLQTGVPFNAGASKYTGGGAAATARASLENVATNAWTILDGGVA